MFVGCWLLFVVCLYVAVVSVWLGGVVSLLVTVRCGCLLLFVVCGCCGVLFVVRCVFVIWCELFVVRCALILVCCLLCVVCSL